MTLESELKAPCKNARAKVKSLGALYVGKQMQHDTYFRHPSRDFRKTDEALRIRKSKGYFLTYKGPKKSKDLKVRQEIEFPVPKDAFILLERLGFKRAFTITKTRETFKLMGLTICCDKVGGLGEYVEVESMGKASSGQIMSVMDKLGLKDQGTTKSYAELLNL
jgi:adenylate cyclase class 2